MPPATPPPPGSRADRRLRRKWAARVVDRMNARRAAERHSGAGFPVDRQVREYLDAYNDRVTTHGFGANMPFSFGALGPFVEETHEEGVPFFRLRPERDHAFRIEDFLDYATTVPPEDGGVGRLLGMPEGETWHFSVLGDVRDLAFQTAEGQRFVFSGISLARRGQSLAWLMVGGIVADLAAQTERLRAEYGAEGVTAVPVWEGAGEWKPEGVRAEPLPGTVDVWKTLAFGTFNLATRRHESRTYSQDMGDLYTMVSDDPDALGGIDLGMVGPAEEAALAAYAEKVERHGLLFEVAETAFMLPAYFDYRIELVRSQERPTDVGRDALAPRERRALMGVPVQERRPFRLVKALDLASPAGAGALRRHYTPPRHQVELGGFYRRLAPNAWGRDEAGNPVPGRTWVRGHVRWRDRPARVEPILVKSSVSAARERAEALVAASEARPAPDPRTIAVPGGEG